MGEPEARVSVIICCYSLERFRDVLQAVSSVLAQTLPPHEVIVSVDHNLKLMEKLRTEIPAGVTLVCNTGIKGLSETRNVGIRAASGDIIAFMDDDAIAEKDWLEYLTQHFNSSAVAAVGGKIAPYWLNGDRPCWFPEELDWIIGCTYLGMPQRGNQVRNLIGCNMAFRSEVFRYIGFFSAAVGRTSKTQGIGEDSELCLRISRNLPGALIVYEVGALVRHKVPAWRLKLGYLFKRSYDEGYHKSTVKRLSSGLAAKTMSTENSYLRYLLFIAIPQRLRHLCSWQAFLQQWAILACIAAVGIGYFTGQLKNGCQAKSIES